MGSLLFIGCGPGRSGGDTVQKLLTIHPHVGLLSATPPLLLDALADLLPAVEDRSEFLPRRAAIAYLTFTQTMTRRLGAAAAEPLRKLSAEVVTRNIFIEAYGTLPLVEWLSREEWLEVIRRFVDAVATTTGHDLCCDKHGPNMLHGSLARALHPESRLVSVLRHPSAAAVSLAESQAVAMPLVEACALVELHYDRWLSERRDDGREHVIAFEHLLREPQRTLEDLGAWLGLDAVDQWALAAAATLPNHVDPRLIHPELAEIAELRLGALAERIGYAHDFTSV